MRKEVSKGGAKQYEGAKRDLASQTVGSREKENEASRPTEPKGKKERIMKKFKDGKIVARSGRFYVNIINPRTFNIKERFYKFYQKRK